MVSAVEKTVKEAKAEDFALIAMLRGVEMEAELKLSSTPPSHKPRILCSEHEKRLTTILPLVQKAPMDELKGVSEEVGT